MKREALLGLRTVIYPAPDLEKARAFYSELLGKAPYFDQPFYVGFNVGGFELGLDPDVSVRGTGDAGGLAYWGVEDVRAAFDRAVVLGARPQQEPREVGGDIWVATVIDPFGNSVGLIQNPHFPNTEGA